MPLAPVYRPRNVQQKDGSYHQYDNCMMASGSTGIDRHTRGKKKSTGAKMRSCQNDRIGGTDLFDLRTAWSRCFYSYLDVRLKITWNTFISSLKAGRGAVVAGWYSYIPAVYRGQASANFAHAVYINEVRSTDGALLMYDPLRATAVWVPQIHIKRFAGYFRTTSGTLGYGYVQCGFTRDTDVELPDPVTPKPPTKPATVVTLRYGGVRMRATWKVTVSAGRQRRSPYIRADNTVRVVKQGARFAVFQKTTQGTKVGTAANASTWYGSADGKVWMHASLLKNA